LIKEINGEESEEEDKDEKDMFPFHLTLMSGSLPRCCIKFGAQIHQIFVNEGTIFNQCRLYLYATTKFIPWNE
jgi:hypothetical protein